MFSSKFAESGPSTAQQICRSIVEVDRPGQEELDASLLGPSTALRNRLRNIRARSTNTSQGSFRAPYQSNSEEEENELSWDDRVLTWTRGCQMVRSFTFAQPVMQAFWTYFEADPVDNTVEVAPGKPARTTAAQSLSKALCVFFEQAIQIYIAELGEQIEMDLPFRFARAFPAPVGFIVQRQVEAEDERIAVRLRQTDPTSHASADPSAMGYPFPNINDALPNGTDVAVDDDRRDPWTMSDQPSRILPMVFYLRRSFDDLVPVDKYPQLSSAQNQETHMTHGPPSPFTEIDESIIFVSTGSDEFTPHIVVTADHATSAIKIYAFAASSNHFDATSTLLSVPRRWPSAGKAAPGFSSRTRATESLADSRTGPTAVSMDQTAGNTSGLGKGFPQPALRGSRLDHDRRASGLGSVSMGRDPSGRSRRISAMHAGSGADRRSIVRNDEGVSQGRDRTIGNISHTADGLRLQSQLYTHENLMDELAPMTSGLRTSAPQSTKTRLRRSSQAARTPYNAPRTSTRQTSSISRTRPSLNLSRLDLGDKDGQTPAALGTSRFDFSQQDAAETTAYPQDDLADLEDIADLAAFARSFACVSLLEEIPIKASPSQTQLASVRVSAATFFDMANDAYYIFISVPGAQQTFCRRIGREQVIASSVPRDLLYSRPPGKSTALATIPTANVAPIHALKTRSPQVLSVDGPNALTLYLGPPSATTPKLDLGSQSRFLSDDLANADFIDCSGSRLTTRSGDIILDMNPTCQVTQAVLCGFALSLPWELSARISAAWLQARFFPGDEHRRDGEVESYNQDWDCLCKVLCSTQTASNDHVDLATSASHRFNGTDELLAGLAPLKTRPTKVTDFKTNFQLSGTTADQVLLTLHLLAEDALLDSVKSKALVPKLAELVVSLAQIRGSLSWAGIWLSRASMRPTAASSLSGRAESSAEPMKAPNSTHDVLYGLLSDTPATTDHVSPLAMLSPDVASLRRLDAAFPSLDAILRIYAAFGEPDRTPASSHKLVSKIVELGFDLSRLQRLPFGVALPLFEALHKSQLNPPDGQTSSFYHMVQRADLVLKKISSAGQLTSMLSQHASQALAATIPAGVSLDPVCAQLFNKDFRLTDVVGMLQTTGINTTYVSEGENQTETAISDQHTAAVAALAERTKALALGRGMLFMASRDFSPTAKWRIPPICLRVKVQPRGLTIEPEISKTDPTGLDWPEFHNGVSSILEVRLSAGVTMDSKWIFAHLGEQITARHAGFLLGLGLMKRLPALTPVHVFRYLEPRNNLLTIGFLLGMAASTIGTADPTARHLIGMQLVAFLPPGSAPLNLSMITQTAGMLAMGLVFLGSNHRWTARRMLDQIGAQETTSPHIQPQHREAYSLSAGLALGLVYLGKGRIDGMKSLPDKKIVARLVQLIQGQFKGVGPRSKASEDQRLRIDAELNLTSIPASLALGFAFLRSGREDVADILAPPRNIAELALIRPDVLFAHVLARHLVLWEGISPDADWLASVLPGWMQEQLRTGNTLSESAQLSYITMRAAACFAVGLKFAGSRNSQARQCLWEQLHRLQKETQQKAVSYFFKIRKAAAQSALDQVLLALSMVMCGSGDIDVLRSLRKSHGDVGVETCYGTHMATHMALGLLFLGGGRFTLGTSDTAIAALTIALMPPFPRTSSDNRAHLQAFRHLWVLAVEPRLLIAADVDTGEMTSLPIKMIGNLHDGSDRKFTPLLLPQFQKVGQIVTATSRYWPTQIDLVPANPRTQPEPSSQVLYVKRKTGHLSYSADPRGSRCTFSRALGTAPLDLGEQAVDLVGPSLSELRELIDGIAGAGRYRELVSSICGPISSNNVHRETSMHTLMRVITMECLTQDKAYILPAYTTIARLQTHDKPNLLHLADVRFADAFYRYEYARLFTGPSLIQQGLLSMVRSRAQTQAWALLQQSKALQRVICRYLGQNGAEQLYLTDLVAAEKADLDEACLVLAATELPAFEDMQQLAEAIRTALANRTKADVVRATLRLALTTPDESQSLTYLVLDLLIDSIARETM